MQAATCWGEVSLDFSFNKKVVHQHLRIASKSRRNHRLSKSEVRTVRRFFTPKTKLLAITCVSSWSQEAEWPVAGANDLIPPDWRWVSTRTALASENAKTHTHTAVYTKILLLMEVEVDSSHRTEAPLVVSGGSQTVKDFLLAINL